jgi:hypothetical protein
LWETGEQSGGGRRFSCCPLKKTLRDTLGAREKARILRFISAYGRMSGLEKHRSWSGRAGNRSDMMDEQPLEGIERKLTTILLEPAPDCGVQPLPSDTAPPAPAVVIPFAAPERNKQNGFHLHVLAISGQSSTLFPNHDTPFPP